MCEDQNIAQQKKIETMATAFCRGNGRPDQRVIEIISYTPAAVLETANACFPVLKIFPEEIASWLQKLKWTA